MAYHRVYTPGMADPAFDLKPQRQAVHAFIGSPPAHEFTEVESGKRSDRPELHKALEFAELTNPNLVVAKLDRLSRDEEFLFRLQKAPIKIKFPTCLLPTAS
jgi:DNA invertase Pin-like site-specific DNA recombinase